jgi:hypothetical protein
MLFVTDSIELTKEALQGFEDFEVGRKVTHAVRCADGFVLLIKEETLLQNMIN